MCRAPANAMPLMPKGTGSILAMARMKGAVHGKFAKVQRETLQPEQCDQDLDGAAKSIKRIRILIRESEPC